MFEQFKENISLATEFTTTLCEGLRSAQATWRRATPQKRIVWLLVPSVIVVSAVADHFSAPWYYQMAALLLVAVLIGLVSGMRNAIRSKRKQNSSR